MKYNYIIKFALILAGLLFLHLAPAIASDQRPVADSQVTFEVAWYDVGKAALEGLEGIKWIEKGFHDLKEINTVYYEPSTITVEEMEDALKKAGTYGGTVK